MNAFDWLRVAFCLATACACTAVPGVAAAAHSDDGTVLELPFANFFRLPVGARGLELSDALKNADGRRVRLVGYMVAREDASPGRFQLTPRPVRLSEHADGDADDLPPATVTVLLDPSQAERTVAHRNGPVALQGRLQIGRSEGTGGRVSWFRLQLDPEALALQASQPGPTDAGHFPSTPSPHTSP